MSRTACWGTNKLVECAWVSFGYGSIYDTSRYWISLEAAKALARLDFTGPSRNSFDGTDEELKSFHPKLRMRLSAWHVNVPDQPERSLEWWIEIEKEMGMDEHSFTRNGGRATQAEIKKLFPEDMAIVESCEERYDVARDCHYQYQDVFFGTSPYKDVSTFDLIWNGKFEELEKLSHNPYAVSTEELLAGGGEDIPEEKDYNVVHNDDGTISCSTVKRSLPDNFLVTGLPNNNQKVDGEYIYTRGYVSAPSDWFIFGGYLEEKHINSSNGAIENHQRWGQEFREYECPPIEWYTFGGHREVHNYKIYKDYYENPALP